MFRSYVKLPEGISFPAFGGGKKAVSPREIKKTQSTTLKMQNLVHIQFRIEWCEADLRVFRDYYIIVANKL